ncbi:MAG: hypothetical protein ACYDAA_17980 [Syntrophales bacterium]
MFVLKMKYGMNGEKVDAFGIRFYGDIDKDAGHLGTISQMLSDPDMPSMIKNKRVTLWFSLEKIRPCKDVSDFLSMLITRLKGYGYEIMISSLDNLVDTHSPEYSGKPESIFPAYERMIHGYNATGGFSVTAEKKDAESRISMIEIERIQKMAIEFGRLVYNRTLKKIDH